MLGLLLPVVCAQGVKEAKNPYLSEYFLTVVLFELFFFIPLGTYLFFFHPDWSLMYFYDPANLTSRALVKVGIGALSLYMLFALLGFGVGSELVRRGRTNTAMVILAAGGVGLAVFAGFTIRQLTQVGTYADWTALPRTTAPLFTHRIGIIIGVDALVAGAVLVSMIRSLARPQGLKSS